MIYNYTNVKELCDRYGAFHDGVIVNVLILSGVKPVREMPWEDPIEPCNDPAEDLHSISYMSFSMPQVRMSILYNLYNWPNEPADRQLEVTFSGVSEVCGDLAEAVGSHIFDLSFEPLEGLIQVVRVVHEDSLSYRSMDNGEKRRLLTCERLKVKEELFEK